MQIPRNDTIITYYLPYCRLITYLNFLKYVNSSLRESNARPSHYKCDALPLSLKEHTIITLFSLSTFIYNIYMYSFILLLFFISTVVQSYTKIQLNSTNVITIRDEIDDAVASQFIYKLNLLQNKNVYVYLDTPGGSIESGNKILMEIQKYNLSCIAERAYSMGFVLTSM